MDERSKKDVLPSEPLKVNVPKEEEPTKPWVTLAVTLVVLLVVAGSTLWSRLNAIKPNTRQLAPTPETSQAINQAGAVTDPKIIDYPGGFPKDLIFELGTLDDAADAKLSDGKEQFTIKYTSGNPLKSVASLYRTQLENKGWILTQGKDEDAPTNISATKNSEELVVTFASSASNTSVTMTYTK